MSGKPLFTLLAFLFLLTHAFAQELEWALHFGGADKEFGGVSYVDHDGNVYLSGNFRGTADFDPGSSSAILEPSGFLDGFMSKLNEKGEFKWVRHFEGMGVDDVGSSFAGDGKLFVSGVFEKDLNIRTDLDTTTLHALDTTDLFFSCMDTAGHLQWIRHIMGRANVQGGYMTRDSENNLYITGLFQESIDIDPGEDSLILQSKGNYDVFIAKYDSLGNLVWDKQIGGPENDQGLQIHSDQRGYLYITGTFNDTVDFDPGPGKALLISEGNPNTFILKLTDDGVFKWAKQLKGKGYTAPGATKLDPRGFIYLSGAFSDTVDFDPGMGTHNLMAKKMLPALASYPDGFIAKYDTSGQLIWAHRLGSEYFDRVQGFDIDGSGNLYIAGAFTKTVDFDPGANEFNLTAQADDPDNPFSTDGFILKLDAQAGFIWAYRIGGNGIDYTGNIVLDEARNIHVSGSFQQTVDFDIGPNEHNLNSYGLDDIFVMKLSQGPNSYSTLRPEVCDSYFSPAGHTYDLSGIYHDTLENAAGHDSIITIYLTVHENFNYEISVEICEGITYDFNGRQLDSSGIYVDTFTTVEGCDSIVSLHLLVPPIKVETVFVTLCADEFFECKGRIFYMSGYCIDTLQTQDGCDSVVNYQIESVPRINDYVNVVEDTLFSLQKYATYQWIHCDSTAIPGATQSYFHPGTSGEYAVVITYNGCIDTSICHEIILTSIPTAMNPSQITYYPNPTHSDLTIDMGGLYQAVDVSVLDLNGKEVMSEQYDSVQYIHQSLQFLDPGLYFIELKAEGGKVEVLKVVVYD